MNEAMTIGIIADAAGVNVETVRFYQRKGLLREPIKPYGGIRRYRPADAERVRFIKSAQRLGFSLDEVAELLQLEDGTGCLEASALAEHKLTDVRTRLGELRLLESVLVGLVEACHAAEGSITCPLIDTLHEKAAGGLDVGD